jgi:hypothetical protein
VSSLDQLNGVPCDSGAGTTRLSYGDNGSVSITCATPTPTPSTSSSGSTTAYPDNTSADPVNLGTVICDGTGGTVRGDNISDPSDPGGTTTAWYEFTYDNTGGCALDLVLGGNTGDAITIFESAPPPNAVQTWGPTTNQIISTPTGNGPGEATFYVAVGGGTTGAEFTLYLG